jgi:hypothetical protein
LGKGQIARPSRGSSRAHAPGASPTLRCRCCCWRTTTASRSSWPPSRRAPLLPPRPPGARPPTWSAACRASSRACGPGSPPIRRHPSPGRRGGRRSSGCFRRRCPSSRSLPRRDAAGDGEVALESRRRGTECGRRRRRGLRQPPRGREAARASSPLRSSVPTHDAEEQANDDDEAATGEHGDSGRSGSCRERSCLDG